MDDRLLIPYIAQDRRTDGPERDDLAARPHGVALFADIVGFTPLTSAFSRGLGPRRGAEALTRVLNTVYDTVIGEVDRFGGSVIDFSGDAIGCWFDDCGEPAAGARRAVTAARAMADAIAALDPVEVPDGATVTMSMKVAVAGGDAVRLTCGDPALRCFDVLAGDAVIRTAAAEKVATQGDVVADASVLELLGTDLDVAELRTTADDRTVGVISGLRSSAAPSPWPVSTVAPPQGATWIDHRLRDRPDDESTELRPAVALFVRIGRVDFDAADGAERLDRIVRSVQGVLDAYDGILIQVTVGDKGNYLYAAFGAPTSHEDVADRAVAAALELRDVLPEAGVVEPPSFGLDQGVARVGAYGGETRRTYGVLGDGTNMAARLMAAARPGEILVTEAVQAATRARLTWEALAPIRVKGREDPMPVTRLVGRPVGTGSRTFGELVGRRAELARLVEVASAVTAGPAGAILIEGEPGVGKSHLVEAARQQLASGADVTWLTVGSDGVRHGPLVPFLPLLRDLFYQELADDDDARHELLDHVIESRCAELGSLDDPRAAQVAETLDARRSFLAALVGLRRDGSAFERHEPSSRLEKCLMSVDTFLRSESLCRPLVVHVRDAHLLDRHSVRLVERLLRTAEEYPMCVLVDRRPDGTDLGLAEDRRLMLGAVSPDDVAAMIEVLAGAPPSAELVEYVRDRTAGNALFVEQLVVDLHRRGGIVVGEHGDAELIAATDDLPPTLDAVLLSRIDHLEPLVRRAVQAASVLGTVFEPGVLARMLQRTGAVAPGDIDGIETALADAERAGVWSATADGRAAFRHALLRDAAYQMQIAASQQAWHRAAARVVADQHGRAAAEVAIHLELAGDVAKAAAAYRRAARSAESAGRRRESLERLVSAAAQARLAGCAPRTLLPLHESTATTAAIIGEHALAIDAFAAALELTETDPAPVAGRRVVWRTRMGESLLRLGRISDAEQQLEAALVDLQDHPHVEVASEIYAELAMVHLRQGELDEAFELAQMASVFGAGVDDAEARAHHHLGVIQWRRGEHDDALRFDELALAACDRRGDQRGRAAVLNNLGLVRTELGDHEAAIDAFRGAIHDFERTGDEHGLACAADNLARLLMEHGSEGEAMQYLERAVEILSRIGIGPDGVVAAMWQSGSW